MRRLFAILSLALAACGGDVTKPDDAGAGDAGQPDVVADVSIAPAGVILSATQGLPRGIAVDDTYVYWANTTQNAVLRCAKTGCAGSPEVLAQGEGWRFALDGTNLYWSEYDTGRVMSCPVASCSTGLTVLASAQPYPNAIAVSATDVYWINSAPSAGIMKCAIGGCGDAPTQLAPLAQNGRALALEGTTLYWATYDYNDGAVMKCDLPSCAPVVVASHQQNVEDMAVDSKNLYWARSDGSGILSCALAGCAAGPTLLAESAQAYGVAIDDSTVYWATGNAYSSGATILSCPKAGCNNAPATVASSDMLQSLINRTPIYLSTNVAVDGTSVYAGNVDGTIVKITPK